MNGIKSLAGWTAAAAALFALFLLALNAGSARSAQAATLASVSVSTHVHAVTPSEKACAVFAAYRHHQTRSGLERLVTASFSVPGKYLGADIAQLYADDEGGGSKYVAKDLGYIGEDCSKVR